MILSKTLFDEYCGRLSFDVGAGVFDKLDEYARLLIEWNKNINLTAITQPDEILVKHFIDSMYLLKCVDIGQNGSLCDVGTGAGFPGAVVSVLRPDISVTLMDSIGKKLKFVECVVDTLGLNCSVVNMRAEDAGQNREYRERYDVVTARAVSQLNKLSEYCVPLTKEGGVFAPLKAVLSDEEAQSGAAAAKLLGARREKRERYFLPDGSEREIIIFKKISQTPPKYPRNSAQIAKKPL